jgi:phage anti-repressor protein
MMSRTAKGKEVREYFLDLEERLQQKINIPQVRDPAIQMLIDMAVRLDEARTIAIEAKELAQIAERKSDLALANQRWLTLREYRHLNSLHQQLPDSACKAYGTFLTGYCMEHNIPVRDQGIADRQWGKEHAYHTEVIAFTLPGWLNRRNGQVALAIKNG